MCQAGFGCVAYSEWWVLVPLVVSIMVVVVVVVVVVEVP